MIEWLEIIDKDFVKNIKGGTVEMPVDIYNDLIGTTKDLIKENEELKKEIFKERNTTDKLFDELSFWNKLKEWLNTKWEKPFSEICISDIVNKMRELEEYNDEQRKNTSN